MTVALNFILMRCFEKLVLKLIRDNIPASLDSTNKLSEPTDTQRLPYLLPSTQCPHTEKKNTYVRMPFLDFSSAFNTISSMKLTDLLLMAAKPRSWLLIDWKNDTSSHLIYIGGAEVEQVNWIMITGITITENLSWSRLCFLRELTEANLQSQILEKFYREGHYSWKTSHSVHLPAIL